MVSIGIYSAIFYYSYYKISCFTIELPEYVISLIVTPLSLLVLVTGLFGGIITGYCYRQRKLKKKESQGLNGLQE